MAKIFGGVARRARSRTLAGLVAMALVPLAAGCASTTDAPEITPSSATTNPTPSARQPPLRTIVADIKGGDITLEVADDADERTRGLSGRDGLDDDAGMLFVWDETAVHMLWMKEMRFPLDFLWLDENRKVVKVHPDVPLQPAAADGELIRYSSEAPVRYAIELDAGMVATLGVGVGDVVEFDEAQID